MDIPTQFGKAVAFTKEMQKKSRIANLRKTVYNVGVGVEEELQGKNYVPWLCSLTYAKVGAWKKEDITFFLNRVRAHLHRRSLPLIYVWVAELQKRGALHYHVLIWLPKGFRLPKFQRYGWWNHGFTDQKIARKSVGYLMKYISKDETKHDYPKGVRVYGYGGCGTRTKRRVRYYRCSARIRRELSDAGLSFSDVDMRKVKGGKADILTGVFFPSEWKMWMLRGIPVFFRVDEGYEDYHVLIDISEKIDNFV